MLSFVDTGIITDRLEPNKYGRHLYCCCYIRRTGKINMTRLLYLSIHASFYGTPPVEDRLMPPDYNLKTEIVYVVCLINKNVQ